GDRRNYEQVHRGDAIGVITQERPPTLRWWLAALCHVFGDRGLPNLNAELKQFAVDAGRTPERVRDTHLANKLTDFRRGPGPTTSGARFPAPVGPKAGTMPTDHGIGFDDLQRTQNAGNQRVEPGEHQSVDPGEGDALRGLPAQYIQLVPQHNDLGLQRCPRPEQPNESAPDQLAEIDHWPRALTDSSVMASRIGFPVATPRRKQNPVVHAIL